MTPAELLAEAFGRVPVVVAEALRGLDPDRLAWRPAPFANSIAWLVWHLSRIQDVQVAALAGSDQVWLRDGWWRRFALPLAQDDHGYGHSSEQVGLVRADAGLLTDYLRATQDRTLTYLADLGEHDLDRVVDMSWDPPVTAGVRLVSIVDDCAQHAGQAAYLRGLLDQVNPTGAGGAE